MPNKEIYTNRFNEVYKKYRSTIYNYCLANLFNDGDSANDACIDVFMAFNKNQDKISDEKVKSWLYSTAEKSVKNTKRKYARKYKYTPMEDINQYDVSVELFDNITLSPEYVEKIMIEIMDNLKSEDRTLFKYRFIEGKNIKEIAEILNMPYDTVYYRVIEMTKTSKKILQKIIDKLPY